MQEAICATDFITGDPSSRAISELAQRRRHRDGVGGWRCFDDRLGDFLDEQRNAVAARQNFAGEAG